MKIKDVIAETGLTDRAIRLYIENGLVAPSCSENYAGRKNIDFTEEDIETLKNIATLRKAGFSINEIKQLRLGEKQCRKTLEKFMEKTAHTIEVSKAVLEKLEAVAVKETVSMEAICESLNSVTQEKSVPETDIELSLGEKIEKIFFLIVSLAGFGWILLALIAQFFILFTHKLQFIAPETEFYIKWATLAYILFVSIFLLFKYKISKKVKFSKKRLITSSVLCLLLIPVCFASYLYNLLPFLDIDMHSETTNLKNYLLIDEEFQDLSDEINEFFPVNLPFNTKSIDFLGKPIFSVKEYKGSPEYFYRYQLVGDNDADLTIYLERRLSDIELQEEIEKYTNMKPIGSSSVTTKKRLNWTVIYYCQQEESPEAYYGGYMYKIFAYNDFSGRARYIMEYNAGSPMGIYTVPYHMELNW